AALAAGSVVPSTGTVSRENPLAVALGTLAPGETATVTFRALLQTATPQLANQAVVSSGELPDVASDDPAQPGAADPTTVAVAPPLALSVADVPVQEGDAGTRPATFTVT